MRNYTNSFLVVHTENTFPDPRNPSLFDDIADRMAILDEKTRIYFMGQESVAPHSTSIPAQIRKYLADSVFFKGEGFEEQALRVKERLLRDNIGKVEICGISHSPYENDLQMACVTDTDRLLRNAVTSEAKKAHYLEASQRLKWTRRQFEDIWAKQIPTQVILELTDARP